MSYYINDDCISCGACAGHCPVEAISEGSGAYKIDASTCVDCGSCADACPVGAVSPSSSNSSYFHDMGMTSYSSGELGFIPEEGVGFNCSARVTGYINPEDNALCVSGIFQPSLNDVQYDVYATGKAHLFVDGVEVETKPFAVTEDYLVDDGDIFLGEARFPYELLDPSRKLEIQVTTDWGINTYTGKAHSLNGPDQTIELSSGTE